MACDPFPRLDLSDRVLSHYDFWTGNTLWRHGTVVGVVDWSGARVGSPGGGTSGGRGRDVGAELLGHRAARLDSRPP
ncbi:phosphotransferase [Terrabacter sp. NPDC080008]|uniref:phosphotransferase n=1 Tax=Terrabacter sp. NPDC080008 TaxID=3155176 RepID=UPI00344F90E9